MFENNKESYRGCTIDLFVGVDGVLFACMAIITVFHTDKTHQINEDYRYLTASEAKKAILSKAKQWLDSYLDQPIVNIE